MLDRLWQGCGHCEGAAHCPFAEEIAATSDPAARTGAARLPIPLTAGIVFLLPLVCAILGGWCVQQWLTPPPTVAGWWQAGGALAGLAIGVLIARGTLAVILRMWRCSLRGDV